MNRENYIKALRNALEDRAIDEAKASKIVDYACRLLNQGLPVIFDQDHLAHLLGYTLDYLQILSNNPQDFYKEYSIPKRHGGRRIIHEPYPNLKEIQRWILDNILLTEGILRSISPAVSGFIPKRDIIYNCTPHVGKKAIVCLDIKDFFGSITRTQVFFIFSELGYGKDVAGMLAHICTLNEALPQGAPTSPMLSNIAMRNVDDRIDSHCKEKGITYTRYADDITFSSARRFNYGHIIGYTRSLLGGKRLNLNDHKTKVFHRNHSQTVTGIVVNEFPQAPRKYRKQIRQEMHYLNKYGLEDHCMRINTLFDRESYVKHMLGKVNFVLHVNKNDREMQGYRNTLHELLRMAGG